MAYSLVLGFAKVMDSGRLIEVLSRVAGSLVTAMVVHSKSDENESDSNVIWRDELC